MVLRFASSLAVVVAAAVAVGTSVGCATTPRSGGDNVAAQYAPLRVGDVATWKVVPGPDEPQTVTVVNRDEQGYFVDDKGGRLAPRSDGIFDGQRYLLREPLKVGAVWTAVVAAGPAAPAGAPGVTERYTITATDAVVTVPAGTFDDCVEVEARQAVRDPNSGRPATLVMQWTWAKGTGLIRVRQSARLDGDKTPLTTATMELLSFTPGPTTTTTTTTTTTP
ncbi:MAG TPA: hypothetical protein VGF99_09880 [Myxococcota bacterium]